MKTLTYQGKTMSITDWGWELGINPGTIRNRISRGLPVEKVLSTEYLGQGLKKRTLRLAQYREGKGGRA